MARHNWLADWEYDHPDQAEQQEDYLGIALGELGRNVFREVHNIPWISPTEGRPPNDDTISESSTEGWEYCVICETLVDLSLADIHQFLDNPFQNRQNHSWHHCGRCGEGPFCSTDCLEEHLCDDVEEVHNIQEIPQEDFFQLVSPPLGANEVIQPWYHNGINMEFPEDFLYGGPHN